MKQKKLFLMTIIAIVGLLIITGCDLLKDNNVIGCDNCVFSNYTESKKIGDVLTEYEKDYSSINQNIFLGHKLDEDNKILTGYVCGVQNKKVFCLESNYSGSKYEANKKILNDVFDEDQCKEKNNDNSSEYDCTGDLNVHISSTGINYVSISKSNECYITADGNMYCYSSN